jgi:hypothetical protein
MTTLPWKACGFGVGVGPEGVGRSGTGPGGDPRGVGVDGVGPGGVTGGCATSYAFDASGSYYCDRPMSRLPPLVDKLPVRPTPLAMKTRHRPTNSSLPEFYFKNQSNP